MVVSPINVILMLDCYTCAHWLPNAGLALLSQATHEERTVTLNRLTRIVRRSLPLVAALAVLLVGIFPASGLTQAGQYEMTLASVTGPHSFSLSHWTVDAFAHKIGEFFGAKPGAGLTEAERQQAVTDYFATSSQVEELEGQIGALANQGKTSSDARLASLEQQVKELRAKRAKQSPVVENLIERQVQSVLTQEDIGLLGKDQIFLPPLFSKLVELPHILVVSARDRITMQRQVPIQRSITEDGIAALEATADKDLNVSSLVVPIGGYSTYPTMIAGTAPRDFIIDTVAHEWCHVYLTFKPLGQSYGKSGENAAMNETACSIFGGDIAALVREQNYGAAHEPRPWETPPAPDAPSGSGPNTDRPATPQPEEFSVNRELRKIYLAAEEKLKANDVAGAEAVMEQGRQTLADHGFYLRKLNQAFFAFYGSYAEGPDAIRPDPIGADLRQLRRQSPTLREFMHLVEQMTSYSDLKQALGK